MALFSQLCKVSVTSSILLTTLAVAGASASKMLRRPQSNNEGKPVQALELKSRDERYEENAEVEQSSILQVSADRFLVSVNNTLYLLNGKKTVVDDMANVPPIVDSRGRIYGIGADVTQFRVDSDKGHHERFGREIGGSSFVLHSNSLISKRSTFSGREYAVLPRWKPLLSKVPNGDR